MLPEVPKDIPWWVHVISYTLSAIVVPLVAIAIKNHKTLKKIQNGGSGTLDRCITHSQEIREEMTAIRETVARLDERTKHHDHSLQEAWKMLDKITTRLISSSPPHSA